MQLCKYLPTPSERMGVIWTLSSIEDAVIVEYGPAGTTHYAIEGFMQLNTDLRARVFTTHMDESDIVMGDTTRLEAVLREVDGIHRPQVIFVVASSVSSIVGTDIASVCMGLQNEIKAKLVWFTGGGFRGDYAVGVEEVLTALAKFVVEPVDCEAIGDTYNIIGSNVDCYNFQADVVEIKRLMWECFGLNNQAVFTANSTLGELTAASRARLNLVLRSEGIECARILEERFGTPYVIGCPYGLGGTQRWLGSIANALGAGANELFIARETAELSKHLQRVRRELFPYGQLNVVVSGNYELVTNILPFLTQELTIGVKHAMVNHRLHRSTSQQLDGLSLLVTPDERERERILQAEGVSVLLGDGVCLEMGRSIPIKLQISNPNLSSVRFYPYTPFMGFRGALYIAEQFLHQLNAAKGRLASRF